VKRRRATGRAARASKQRPAAPRRAEARRAPAKAPAVRRPPRVAPAGVEARALPIARELGRIARGSESPRLKLEGALEILFGAYASGDSQLADVLLDGWVRARRDKGYRLTMAWVREQARLSVEEILVEGVAAGVFRPAVEPRAVAAALLGAAEGALLHARDDGGVVDPPTLLRALVALLVSEA
jgi:hypothetical protein